MPGVNEGITLGQLYEALLPFYSKDSKLFELVGPEMSSPHHWVAGGGNVGAMAGTLVLRLLPQSFWATEPNQRNEASFSKNADGGEKLDAARLPMDNLLDPKQARSSVNLETSSRFILNGHTILKLKQYRSFLGIAQHTEYAAS